MKLTITGSLGNVSRYLVRSLSLKGHELKVISSNLERIKGIEELNAKAAIGSVDDYDFLVSAFEGADGVYTMIPPNFATTDLMKNVGRKYARAIKQTGIQYVVNLSGIGSHISDGPGPAGANHYIEKIFNELKNTHVLHLRPGMFYTNFYGSIELIKRQNIIGNNFNGEVNLPLTHPKDIADIASEALDTPSFNGKNIRYVVSDEKTGKEIATILGQAIGKPNLQWVEFPDEEWLQGLIQAGMPKQMASTYIIEMGIALREDKLLDDYRKHKSEALGIINFEEFSKEFATVFKNSS